MGTGAFPPDWAERVEFESCPKAGENIAQEATNTIKLSKLRALIPISPLSPIWEALHLS
jgi:hypothetical protein